MMDIVPVKVLWLGFDHDSLALGILQVLDTAGYRGSDYECQFWTIRCRVKGRSSRLNVASINVRLISLAACAVQSPRYQETSGAG